MKGWRASRWAVSPFFSSSEDAMAGGVGRGKRKESWVGVEVEVEEEGL